MDGEDDEGYFSDYILKLNTLFNKSVVLVVSCYSETVAYTLTHIHKYTSRHMIFNNKPSMYYRNKGWVQSLILVCCVFISYTATYTLTQTYSIPKIYRRHTHTPTKQCLSRLSFRLSNVTYSHAQACSHYTYTTRRKHTLKCIQRSHD